MSQQKTKVLHAQPRPLAWLAIVSGRHGGGRDFRLGDDTDIGRDAVQCSVIVDDEFVSARHAKIRFENGTFVLYDLASTNLTLVNGERVERAVLEDGDKVTLGETAFVFKRAQ